MSDKSKIEWTDATWNPVRGCTRVSPGCEHCYAERQVHRFNQEGAWGEGLTTIRSGKVGWSGKVKLVEDVLDQPLRWRKPRRVFVCSISDLFHAQVPFAFIARVFGVMAQAPKHTFQVLTKRPERAAEFFEWLSANPAELAMLGTEARALLANYAPPPWIHIGVSVEDEARMVERVPLLLERIPAAVRWLSCEPLLGPIDLRRIRTSSTTTLDGLTGNYVTDRAQVLRGRSAGIDWVVVGGESGPGARPMHPAWVRAIRDDCRVTGTPFFFKQWGEYAPHLDGGRFTHGGDETDANAHVWLAKDGASGRCWVVDDDGNWSNCTGDPTGRIEVQVMARVGKGRAGRTLDWEIHDGAPPDRKDMQS